MDPPQSAQERHWLESLRSGSFQAFEAIYAAFAPTLYSFAQRSVPADVAEDIVQDVLVDLWDRRAALNIHSSLRSYLLGAAWRRILNTHRSTSIDARARERMIHEEALLVMGRSSSPQANTETQELQQALTIALASLPQRAQLVLSMRWNDGLTYEQIGAILGLSAAAAKKQGQRAEQALRALLHRFAP